MEGRTLVDAWQGEDSFVSALCRNRVHRVTRFAVMGWASVVLVGVLAVSVEAQASATHSHMLKNKPLCKAFKTESDNCRMGTVARGDRIFDFGWKTFGDPGHWTTLHASRSSCTSISLSWTPGDTGSTRRTSLTIVTDSGSKTAEIRGRKVGTVSAKLTGPHAFVVRAFNSFGGKLLVAGRATCKTASGH